MASLQAPTWADCLPRACKPRLTLGISITSITPRDSPGGGRRKNRIGELPQSVASPYLLRPEGSDWGMWGLLHIMPPFVTSVSVPHPMVA